ncbi:hypothetical protein [uncultured Bacteroides sp.]|uniref:hypothetical protein n=1 Tax=uncultured Bacteroides sp. TaxID=162156 RepID=UPI00262C356C|nr:hypothetical protein [uncultured Bacteroides sp.]
MKDLNQKKVKEENDLKKEEIVPAEDVLTNEMEEEVEGGKLNICISGKIAAEDIKKSEELH